MTYAEKLKSPKWQRKRLEILSRDEFTCQKCGDKETELQVHHKKYAGPDPWDAEDEDLETLCKFCHIEIEHFKKHGGFRIDDMVIYKGKYHYDGGVVHPCLFTRIYDNNDQKYCISVNEYDCFTLEQKNRLFIDQEGLEKVLNKFNNG